MFSTLNIHQASCFWTTLPLNEDVRKSFGHLVPDHLSASPTMRKDEYLAGRLCAFKAAEEKGINLNDLQAGQTREPLWPPGVVGSISHSKTRAISCVARASEYKSIGMDTEVVMDDLTIEKVKHIVSLPEEIDILKGTTPEISFNIKFTLLFSIKESLYKALYPLNKKFIDFNEVSLTDISFQKSIFTVLYKKLSFQGSFFIEGESVITVLAIGENCVHS